MTLTGKRLQIAQASGVCHVAHRKFARDILMICCLNARFMMQWLRVLHEHIQIVVYLLPTRLGRLVLCKGQAPKDRELLEARLSDSSGTGRPAQDIETILLGMQARTGGPDGTCGPRVGRHGSC